MMRIGNPALANSNWAQRSSGATAEWWLRIQERRSRRLALTPCSRAELPENTDTMKRPNPEKLAAQAAQWNLSHPIGTPVMRYKLIAPLREGTETKTRSEAWVMGGHSVMVMVEGVSGGVLLESVKPCLSNVKCAPTGANERRSK